MSKNRFVSPSSTSGIHNDNDNSSPSVLMQQHPPHSATFDLHGYSTAAQMELTGQVISSLSLLADSAPKTKELRTALEESFAMVRTMMDKYIQITKNREEWWKAQLQQERAMYMVWEESLQTVAREGDVFGA